MLNSKIFFSTLSSMHFIACLCSHKISEFFIISMLLMEYDGGGISNVCTIMENRSSSHYQQASCSIIFCIFVFVTCIFLPSHLLDNQISPSYFPSFIFVAWPTRFKNTTHQIKLDEFWEFALYYCISAYGVIRILRYCDFLWFSANGQFWRSWCCILSRFSVEIKTIFLALSIMFYLHYFVLSIIIDNKIDNIDPIN